MQSAEAAAMRIMQGQHGLITSAQAQAVGMSRAAVWRRVNKGIWVRCLDGIYRSAAHPSTWRSGVTVACLASAGVASHRTAAALWTIDGYRPGTIEVVASKSSSRRRPGFRLHESLQMHLVDRHTIDSIPVTGPARTLLDLSGVVGMKRLNQALDDLLRRDLVDWPMLYSTLIKHACRGRNGIVRFRNLLESRSEHESIPLSMWSRMVADMLVDAGLPRPELEYRVHDRRGQFVAQADLAYPEQRVLLELDSVRWHLNLESFHKDPIRRNALTRSGYDVYNITWDFYVNQPAELCRMVADAIGLDPSALRLTA